MTNIYRKTRKHAYGMNQNFKVKIKNVTYICDNKL